MTEHQEILDAIRNQTYEQKPEERVECPYCGKSIQRGSMYHRLRRCIEDSKGK